MNHQMLRYVYLAVQFLGLAACFSPVGPIVGMIIIIIGGLGYRYESKLIKEEQKLIKCPYCAEKILPDAKICKHCHKEIAS